MAKSWGYRLHEWRDLPPEDRDLLLAHDLLVCSRCGNLKSVCSDSSIDWHPDTAVCWPTAAVEWGDRTLRERYADRKVADHALRETDGVVVYPSLTAPADDPFA